MSHLIALIGHHNYVDTVSINSSMGLLLYHNIRRNYCFDHFCITPDHTRAWCYSNNILHNMC